MLRILEHKINNRLSEIERAQGLHPATKAKLIKENKRFLEWVLNMISNNNIEFTVDDILIKVVNDNVFRKEFMEVIREFIPKISCNELIEQFIEHKSRSEK